MTVYTYQFVSTSDSSFTVSLRVTTVDTLVSMTLQDNNTYQGYAIGSVTGTIDGVSVVLNSADHYTGRYGTDTHTSQKYDNMIFASDSQGLHSGGTLGSRWGIDADGLDLTSSNASTYYSLQWAGQSVFTLTESNGQKITLQLVSTTAPCFCEGTSIETEHGARPVESLAIGDRVLTMSGALRPIKWIGRRSYAGRFIAMNRDVLPICIEAGALEEGVPRRDLRVSPHHAMYIDGVLIEAKDLVNGASIQQAESVESVAYFHIELDSHDVIFAEGAATESFIDDESRGLFQNAEDYYARYGDDAREPGQYCAPRLFDGAVVEAVRRRLLQRAGLDKSGSGGAGTVRGHVDLVTPDVIEGWAQIAERPEAPVCVAIYAGAQCIGEAFADLYRADLSQAGLGSGKHAFRFALPAGGRFDLSAIEVRCGRDGTVLPRSLTQAAAA